MTNKLVPVLLPESMTRKLANEQKRAGCNAGDVIRALVNRLPSNPLTEAEVESVRLGHGGTRKVAKRSRKARKTQRK